MYKKHDLFKSPPPKAALWRYIDFTKFVSLLDRSALFFVRADKLGDPFEGSYTKHNKEMRQQIYQGDIPEEVLRSLYEFVRNNRQNIMLSCWHRNEHESAAMWRLYSRESDGIAIRTDFDSLSKSLTGVADTYIGSVSYVDYTSTFIREDNLLAPFIYKRKSFEHEREVRALIARLPSHNGDAAVIPDNPAVGVYEPTDLSILIKEIVVAPYAEDWFLRLVESVASRYGLEAVVNRSSDSQEPVWS